MSKVSSTLHLMGAITKKKTVFTIISLKQGLRCDSCMVMTRKPTTARLPSDKVSQGFALAGLLLLAGLAFAGPSGVLAWGENVRLLEQRNAQIAMLQDQTAELRNRTELLDPKNADPDLVGELLRSNLGFVHPDEVVIELP